MHTNVWEQQPLAAEPVQTHVQTLPRSTNTLFSVHARIWKHNRVSSLHQCDAVYAALGPQPCLACRLVLADCHLSQFGRQGIHPEILPSGADIDRSDRVRGCSSSAVHNKSANFSWPSFNLPLQTVGYLVTIIQIPAMQQLTLGRLSSFQAMGACYLKQVLPWLPAALDQCDCQTLAVCLGVLEVFIACKCTNTRITQLRCLRMC